MCDKHNQFSRIYCHAEKGLNQAPSPHPEDRIFLNPQFNLQLERGQDKNRENLLTASKVAMIIPSECTHFDSRDILLTERAAPPSVPPSILLAGLCPVILLWLAS